MAEPEDHSLTEGRVEELRRLVHAAEHEAEDESDEEDEYDIQIVSHAHVRPGGQSDPSEADHIDR